eukprot:NODE_9229_length_349_cov_101.846939.p3 GENE.NODE_9229_length_349_cov_101.846939~~NODE_9229_length_349_cov_101.846939.p3  ORF type:complete len:83 (-),score=11.13 NODE_9229_length_349_cov_101.846939:41-289(-)
MGMDVSWREYRLGQSLLTLPPAGHARPLQPPRPPKKGARPSSIAAIATGVRFALHGREGGASSPCCTHTLPGEPRELPEPLR